MPASSYVSASKSGPQYHMQSCTSLSQCSGAASSFCASSLPCRRSLAGWQPPPRTHHPTGDGSWPCQSPMQHILAWASRALTTRSGPACPHPAAVMSVRSRSQDSAATKNATHRAAHAASCHRFRRPASRPPACMCVPAVELSAPRILFMSPLPPADVVCNLFGSLPRIRYPCERSSSRICPRFREPHNDITARAHHMILHIQPPPAHARAHIRTL